jgi:hypothetical protein
VTEYASVVEALRCAVEVQRGMAARTAATLADRRIEFRCGVNLGDHREQQYTSPTGFTDDLTTDLSGSRAVS